VCRVRHYAKTIIKRKARALRDDAVHLFVCSSLYPSVRLFVCRLKRDKTKTKQFTAGLPWVWGSPWGFPWVWVWNGYGDYDKSPWVCGDSLGIFEWIPNYVETS